jgi:KDO2-lipid IV(A) lauroyltransferase
MASLNYAGHRLASIVANALPRPWLNGVCFLSATLCLVCDRRGRRAVYANLRQLFAQNGRRYGPLGLWRQVWHVFINYGKFMAEFFGDRRFDGRWLDRNCDFSGQERIDRVLAKYGGCIFLSAHFGNWELLGAKIIRLGYRGPGVGEEWPDERVRLLLRRFRANRGYYMFHYAGAARQLLAYLRGGNCVFMVGDRNVSTDPGVPVEFLGRPVRFPRGPERLALAAGVPLVPVFARRAGDRLEAEAGAPILPPPRGARFDRDREMQRMAQEFARAFEEQLGAAPHQWNGAFIEELGTRANPPGAAPPLPRREQEKGESRE